jgi:hypothetical protein
VIGWFNVTEPRPVTRLVGGGGDGMRTAAVFVAVLCCVAAAGGIAYLHGFERALGHEAWRHRPALIRAYSGEVAFRAGACALLAVAAVLAARFRVRPLGMAVVAVVGSGLSAAGTYVTIRLYVMTPPGGLMRTTDWDGVSLLLWLAGAVAVAGTATLGVRRSRGNPSEPAVAPEPRRQ